MQDLGQRSLHYQDKSPEKDENQRNLLELFIHSATFSTAVHSLHLASAMASKGRKRAGTSTASRSTPPKKTRPMKDSTAVASKPTNKTKKGGTGASSGATKVNKVEMPAGAKVTATAPATTRATCASKPGKARKSGAPESLDGDGFMLVDDGAGKGKDSGDERSSSGEDGDELEGEDPLVDSEDELGAFLFISGSCGCKLISSVQKI